MPTLRHDPDGTWRPAHPLGYHPGWDAERTRDGWTLYRTTATSSTVAATGHTRIGLAWAWVWRRILLGVPRDTPRDTPRDASRG